ncbi:8099_t:CDS:1, partial [Gigaspora rosea]
SMLKNYEAVNEYLSDDSKCNDIDKIDNAEFPSIVDQDSAEI